MKTKIESMKTNSVNHRFPLIPLVALCLGAIGQPALGQSAPFVVLAESTFDTSSDGWTAWDSKPPYASCNWIHAGGGGSVQFHETSGDGAATCFAAPSKFLGDMSGRDPDLLPL